MLDSRKLQARTGITVGEDLIFTQYTTTFTPNKSGIWRFSFSVVGIGNLFITSTRGNSSDRLTLDLTTDAPQSDSSFFGMGTIERVGILNVVEGQQYAMEARISNTPLLDKGAPFSTRGGIKIDGNPSQVSNSILTTSIARETVFLDPRDHRVIVDIDVEARVGVSLGLPILPDDNLMQQAVNSAEEADGTASLWAVLFLDLTFV